MTMDNATLTKHAEAILRALHHDARYHLEYSTPELQAILTALRAAVEDGVPSWMPIETAPDGVWVISWGPDGHGLLKIDPIIRPHLHETHWMPLPSAPNAEPVQILHEFICRKCGVRQDGPKGVASW